MQISAIQRFTLIDFPGRVAAIVFLPGCNFRCGFCHNPEFVLPEKIKEIQSSFFNEDVFFNFLGTRKGKLDGVVISGGEPTIYQKLPEFIKKIKNLGFQVKLDTNGSNPEMLKDLLDEKLLDYVALDYKMPFDEYLEVTKYGFEEKLKRSYDLLLNSGIEYELRSTLIKQIHTPDLLEKMSRIVGDTKWYLQTYRNEQVLDDKYKEYCSYSEIELKFIKEKLLNNLKNVYIR